MTCYTLTSRTQNISLYLFFVCIFVQDVLVKTDRKGKDKEEHTYQDFNYKAWKIRYVSTMTHVPYEPVIGVLPWPSQVLPVRYINYSLYKEVYKKKDVLGLAKQKIANSSWFGWCWTRRNDLKWELGRQYGIRTGQTCWQWNRREISVIDLCNELWHITEVIWQITRKKRNYSTNETKKSVHMRKNEIWYLPYAILKKHNKSTLGRSRTWLPKSKI